MMIKDEGYTITEVPGVERITVEPDGDSEPGAQVLIKFYGMDKPLNYGLAQLRELNEALYRAHTLGLSMLKPVAER